MSALPGRLGSLTARDVMTGEVVTLRPDDSLQDAIQQLRDHHITGAPVVDEQGRLLGILSLADMVEAEAEVEDGAAAGSKSRPATSRPLAHGRDHTSWDLFDRAQPVPPDRVGEQVRSWMSTEVAAVVADAPIVEAARIMCDGHWHRVPVVDDAGSMVGIVSTMDILSALVGTADES